MQQKMSAFANILDFRLVSANFMTEKNSWEFWVDRGGTFTDIIARCSDGRLLTAKQLSESPDYDDAAVFGINEILRQNQSTIAELAGVRMGTTIGTNALLERKGERTVFVTTRGFADAVRIGYQHRPNIFALEILLPQMIYEEVVEFVERVDAAGRVDVEPDIIKLREDLSAIYQSGIRSCAIALLHAYRYPRHEIMAANIAREIGFTQISVSHECAALMKFVSRADTTLVDAYLTPLLRQYIGGLKAQLADAKLSFMQSNGGLADSSIFRGKDSILSGPAGGLVGAIKAAQSCGFQQLITFDMGGTSTDVSHFGGEIDYIYDTEIAGMRIRAPMMDIHTVAAGGGSILRFDGSRCLVGPDSAGANPGPLSYRRKGPLALTDANLMLGRIQPDHFPRIFGASRNQSLDLEAVQQAFASIAGRIHEESGVLRSPEEVALGFIKIAVAKMANAIKHVSVQRGHDLRQCALVSFGGAGGQHACMIAEELGIRNILIHPLAGLLSAYGIGLAESRLNRDIDLNQRLEELNVLELNDRLEVLKNELSSTLASKGIPRNKQETLINALIRMEGSDYALSVPYGGVASMADMFKNKHLARYGFIDENRKLVLASLSVQLVGQESTTEDLQMPDVTSDRSESKQSTAPDRGDNSGATVRLFDDAWRDCPLFERHRLLQGKVIQGPAIITEENTTTVVDEGWQAQKLSEGSLLLTYQGSAADPHRSLSPGSAVPESDSRCSAPHHFAPCKTQSETPGTSTLVERDPVTLELFNNLFRLVAEQMGLTLQNTSQSVNIKERLDFSCALFDGDGNLVANAPHMPVHLGSMGESVKSLLAFKGGSMLPGDAYATNDPYAGGTHLPDITVISPCFDASGKHILFFVASRGHHADIGGITPGSMPADSRNIEEEGALFQHMLVMRDKQVLDSEITAQLVRGKYPARRPAQNLADLKAQIAANARGIKHMEELTKKWGEPFVLAYMGYVQDNAEECVKRAIMSLSSGSFSCTMDDGNKIQAEITINKEEAKAHIDFSGTSPQASSNFNAPLAVCKAAVLYVFRTLIKDEIPLNSGCFRPLSITVPPESLLNPSYPAPVVAGNVETSQVIVDVLYGALGIMAASQGTMNNFSFGNDRYQYYETVCGGTGAGAAFNGAGPVQSHMTNSRLTDPEVLESRFPVLLESFAVRRGSGGSGKFRGGDGAVRCLRFLEEMTASILSNRRSTTPYGLCGGGAGKSGRNYIKRADGSITNLLHKAGFRLAAGDRVTIETPGGGGYG